MTAGSRRAALLACGAGWLLVSLSNAFAQGFAVPALPGELSEADKTALQSQRAGLLERRDELLAGIRSHNARCGSVREDSPLVPECSAAQERLQYEVKRYQDDVDSYERALTAATARYRQRRDECAAVATRAKSERERIESLRRSITASQQELTEWTKLSAESQKQALTAAATFVLGEYSADLESVQHSVSRLGDQAASLTQKAARARKYKTRLKYLAELRAAAGQLDSQATVLALKSVSKSAADAEKSWEVARDTLHHEFRVAAKRNGDLRAILRDPQFREAFLGDDMDTPGLDVLAALVEEAGEHAGKLELGLKHYEEFTGPTVRAFVFVRDAWYSAVASGLSTARVIQHSDVEGQLAVATRSAQQQFQATIQALRDCRAAGFP